MCSCRAKRRKEHSSPLIFSRCITVACISTCPLLVAVHHATKSVRFSPLLKPLESDAPSEWLLSVSTTNSSGGKIHCSLWSKQKVPYDILSSKYMWCSKSSEPLGVLFHVIQVWSHDEVFGVNETVLVSVLLPAGVVALVGDVTLTSSCLKLSEVQPCLIIL